jgi:hypothetical protein
MAFVHWEPRLGRYVCGYDFAEPSKERSMPTFEHLTATFMKALNEHHGEGRAEIAMSDRPSSRVSSWYVRVLVDGVGFCGNTRGSTLNDAIIECAKTWLAKTQSVEAPSPRNTLLNLIAT